MPKMQTDDGVDIHYRIDDFRDPWATDAGDTILMSHGFARNLKWWTTCVPALSRKYRIVRVDVRGCGESSAPPEVATWSADRIARDALDLIDHLGIEKVHWVGFESGGMWGYVFALNHPERLKSLTALNTPSAMAGRRISAVPQGGSHGAELMEKVGLRQWVAETNAMQMYPSVVGAEMISWSTEEQSKTPTHVGLAILGVLENLDLTGKYSQVKAPTLIMIGDDARNCPLEEQVAVRREIPNARLVVIPNVGTGVQLVMPDDCTRELISFLADV